MAYAIQILGAAGPSPNPPHMDVDETYFVQTYDPDAFDGRGSVTTTTNVLYALHFASAAEAWECWKQQSTVRPTRHDGRPNRPLTAFSVTVVPVTEAGSAFYKSLLDDKGFVRQAAREASREDVRAAAKRAAENDSNDMESESDERGSP